MTFGNKKLGMHLLRGAIGLGALWISLATVSKVWWPALLLMPLALWMLKGCPMCWTVGLFESLAWKIHGQEHDDISKSSGSKPESFMTAVQCPLPSRHS